MRFNVGVDFGRAGPPGGLGYWQGRCDFLGNWPDTDKVLASVDIPISPVSVYPSILAPSVDYGGARFVYQACDDAGLTKDSLRQSEAFVPQDNYTYTIVYYIGRLSTGEFDLLMLMPMPMPTGPPLPIGLGIYWPWIGRLP
jgi:hypothetical protein